MHTQTHNNAEMIHTGFDNSHRVLGALVSALQEHFKEETHYDRPLLAPQVNMSYALDIETAQRMVSYMSEKLRNACGFAEDEFRFTRKGDDDSGLQRIRLEFTQGVTVDLLRKVMDATEALNKSLHLN